MACSQISRTSMSFLRLCTNSNTSVRTYFAQNLILCLSEKNCVNRSVARSASSATEAENSELVTLDSKQSKSELDDVELERKRNKSRIPEYIRKEVLDLVPNELKFDSQYRLSYLRHRYAKYGTASGLNPGICWPTREELASVLEYESLGHPELFATLERLKQKKTEEAETKRAREQLILKNMEKLPKWRQEMLDRKYKRQSEIDKQTAKKELMIEEVQEYLGYHVDVKDPKFQDLLLKKEEETKKAKKAAKKKEKHEKTLAQLLSVGESIQKAAEGAKPPADSEEKEKK